MLNKKRIDNRMIIVTDATEMGWKQEKHFTMYFCHIACANVSNGV